MASMARCDSGIAAGLGSLGILVVECSSWPAEVQKPSINLTGVAVSLGAAAFEIEIRFVSIALS